MEAGDLAPGGKYPVRDVLIRAYQYLIARIDLDGYRIDTLMYVGTRPDVRVELA